MNATTLLHDLGQSPWLDDITRDFLVPALGRAAALYQRVTSSGEADFQDKLLSAMRWQFGGHAEKKQ